MILKAYYSGGRIDVFDTDHHVDAVPQRGTSSPTTRSTFRMLRERASGCAPTITRRMPIGRSRDRQAFP